MLLIILGQPVAAQQQCTSGEGIFADGALSCFSTVRDGKIQPTLYSCRDGVWADDGKACPSRFTYFCQIGPHALMIGERWLLGTGPASLECRFPGVLSIESSSTPARPAPGGRSRLVRDVQHFLSKENAGLACQGDQCSGEMDGRTVTAMSAFVSKNFDRLMPDERIRLGIENRAQVESVLQSKSPIDLIPAFIRVFDVPSTD